jgi:polar amino acid transport system substrate-binding protein
MKMTMQVVRAGILFLTVMLAGCASLQDERSSAEARHQLAPTGKARAAISVGPTASTFRATLDPGTNRPHGVAVDLAHALGRQLDVPVELVTYSNYPDLLNAAVRGEWDVTFLQVDLERTKVLDYGPAYFFFDFTYLVPDGSPIRAESDIDRPNVRIAVAEGSVTARNRERALKNATLVRFKTLAEIRDQVRAGKVDAAAAGRETLTGLAAQLAGARVLEGAFLREGVHVAVPKNRPAALAYVTEFIEAAKASGVVRRALDDAGFKDAVIAPAVFRR